MSFGKSMMKLGQEGGSRTDTLIKLVLIFFISLLSFSVGTFVGKQFSDSQHKKVALESEYEGNSRETASVPSDSLEVKPDEALTDKDIQKIAEEFTKPDAGHGEAKPEPIGEHGNAHAEAKPDEEARHVASSEHHDEKASAEETHVADHEVKAPAPSHSNTAPSHAAERVAAGHEPSVNKPVAVSHMPANLPSGVAASSIGKFTVQISSHQSEAEANNKATELKGKGFSAFVVPALVKGKQWYRVSVGLYDDISEAKSSREKLLKEAGVSSAFVQRIVQ